MSQKQSSGGVLQKKDVLRSFAKFTGKHLCQILFFNEVAGQYIDIKRKSQKKSPSDKMKGTKNTFFFLLQAPTHDSFTFNLRFLYELNHRFGLSKTVCARTSQE